MILVLYFKGLKFHRFVIIKTCSSHGSKIIFAGFAFNIANPHKINSRHRNPPTKKTYDFSIRYIMHISITHNQNSETLVKGENKC